MTQQEIIQELSAIMNLRTWNKETHKFDTTHGRILDMLSDGFNVEREILFDSVLFFELGEAMAEVIVRHFEE